MWTCSYHSNQDREPLCHSQKVLLFLFLLTLPLQNTALDFYYHLVFMFLEGNINEIRKYLCVLLLLFSMFLRLFDVVFFFIAGYHYIL